MNHAVSGHDATADGIVSVMDVGGTHVSAANVDLGTRSIIPGQSVRLPLESDATAEHFVTALCACAALLPTRPGRDWSIALPGPFDYERGIAHYEGVGKFDALRGYDVRAALTARLPGAGRIRFHNDADAFGLGEWWVGAARGCRRVVGVTLGTGIGSCFVEGGRAVAEGPGIAPDGRIDQLLYEGRPLEETVSRRAVRRAYAQATGGEPADVDVKEIAQLARRGDRAAAAIFERAFRALGNVLAPVLAAFEPEMLVVGGSIAGSWDLIAKPLLAGIGEADLGVDRIALEPALYPAAAPLLGAAYLASRESR